MLQCKLVEEQNIKGQFLYQLLMYKYSTICLFGAGFIQTIQLLIQKDARLEGFSCPGGIYRNLLVCLSVRSSCHAFVLINISRKLLKIFKLNFV